MIKVIVELLPYGSEENKKKLGEGHIANDGTGNIIEGNYVAAFKMDDDEAVYVSKVKKFPRTKKNVWELLQKALVNKKKEK